MRRPPGTRGLFRRQVGTDTDVALWTAAVIANGGTVSGGRISLISSLIGAWKGADCWSKIDDVWLLTAENAPQALTSLKQRRLATAVNSPTFTADQGYAFDGLTNYINTGFVASTHATVMTGSDLWCAVYERTNYAASRYHGAYDNGTSNIDFCPRTGTNLYSMGANSTVTNFGTSNDNRGLIGTYRTAAPVFGATRNGVSDGTYVPASSGTTLVPYSLCIGCENVRNVFGNFRGATVGAMIAGSSAAGLSVPLYTALQSFMTAIGANV